MSVPTLEDIQHDELAMSVAGALAIANEAAVAEGVDLAQSMVTIAEDSPPPDRVWRIHYGRRDYKLRRGGDLIVLVDERAGAVKRILKGQ